MVKPRRAAYTEFLAINGIPGGSMDRTVMETPTGDVKALYTPPELIEHGTIEAITGILDDGTTKFATSGIVK
jgi:hypothetical protein